MALTKISTAMISQSAAAVDLNVDAGTFYVDTTNNRVGVGGKTDPDTPLHVIGTATATTFAGSGASLTDIPNSALTNSSITINSTAVSLGGSLTLTTANIAENTNLYYTDARADARIAAADTDDLSEGSSNLYYTDARVDARVSGGSLGNITTTGYIRGPATFTLDPAAHGDNTGTVVIAGNLQVDGVTTTINSTTLTVDDKNITLASGSANAAAASGAGFTVDIGTGTNPAITYDGTNDEWDFNKPLNVTGNIVVSGTVDGVDIAARDGVLTSTTTTAGAALPKAGGTMTGGLLFGAGVETQFGGSNQMGLFTSSGTSHLRINSGIFKLRADDMRFTAQNGTTEFMRIDSSGRVGINQTPLANNFALQVTGLGGGSGDARAVYLKGSGAHTTIGGTGPTLVLQNTNSTANNITKLSFESASSGETVSINSITTNHSSHYGDMAFNTRGSAGYSEKMRIMANGNVGIGTANPIEKLDVNSYTGIAVNNNYAHMGSTVSGGMAIFGHNIKSDSTSNTIKSANTGYHSSMIKMYYDQGITFHATSGTNTAGDTFYNISGTTNELMRITNDGKVGIGTDDPDHPLEVVGAISSADTGLQKATFANVGNDLVMTANAGATNVSSNIIFKSSQSGGSAAERMRIGSNGSLELAYAGATRQQADSQAFSIITPASGGGQGIAFKRLDSNNDQGLGEISWSNNTQDGQANIRVKTAGAVNSTDMHFDVNNAGTLVTAISIDGSAGGNVGIGTDTPGGKFVVSNSGAEGIEFFPAASSAVNTTQHYNRSGSAYVKNRTIALNHEWTNGATDPAMNLIPDGDSTFLVIKAKASTYNSTANLSLYGTNPSANGGSLVSRATIQAQSDGTAFGTKLSFFTNNTSNVETRGITIDAAQNVGIGDDNPDNKLVVKDGNIKLKSNADGNTGILMLYDAAGTQSGQVYPSAGDLRIWSPNDVLLLPTGNVGIGTDSPYGKLQIEGNTNSWTTAPVLVFASTSTATADVRDWAIGPADSNYGDFHILQGASTGASPLSTPNAKLTISAAGKVGIGNTDPGAMWQVANSLVIGDGTRYNEGMTFYPTATGGSMIAFANTNAAGGAGKYDGYISYSQSTHRMTFSTNMAGTNNATSYDLMIDGDGVVMMGGFTVDPATGNGNQKGFSYRPNLGRVEISSSSENSVLELNRYSGDGDMQVFSLAGAEFGSIGINNTRFTIEGPDNPVRITTGTSNIQINHDTHITFDTANTERMRIESSGTVRMTKGGTAFTPLSYDGLVIQNGDATGIRLIDAGNGGGNGGHCGIGNDNGHLVMSTAGTMMFDTGFEATDQLYAGRHTRMLIDTSGNVGIGTGTTGVVNPNVTSAGVSLQVAGPIMSGRAQGFSMIASNASKAQNIKDWFVFSGPGTNSSGNYVHMKTNLSNSTANSAYTMSCFTYHSYYAYGGNATTGGYIGWHNWGGSYYNVQKVNNGASLALVQSSYVSSDNNVVLVALVGTGYSQFSIDWHQWAGYPFRTAKVTAVSMTTSATGAY